MKFRLLLLMAGLSAVLLGQLSGEQQARVERLQNRILAPCCYSEPVSLHQSDVSLQMRAEIHRMVADGLSDREILDHYIAEYGLRVLVEPEGELGVWIHVVPVVVIVFGLFVGVMVIRKWVKPLPAADL